MKVDWSKEYKVTVDRPAVLPCDEGLLFLNLSLLQLIPLIWVNLVSFVILGAVQTTNVPGVVGHCALIGALSSLFF